MMLGQLASSGQTAASSVFWGRAVTGSLAKPARETGENASGPLAKLCRQWGQQQHVLFTELRVQP